MTTRHRRVSGKGGFVQAIVTTDAEDEADRRDSDGYVYRTDSRFLPRWDSSRDRRELDDLDESGYLEDDDYSDEADRREARAALEDYSADRRMTNHKRPLAATKSDCTKAPQKKRPKPEPVPRRDGISADAARRMDAHKTPLKFNK